MAGPSPGSATAYATSTSPIMHFICPLPPPKKKKKKKNCITFSSFLLGITAIPIEIEKNAYAKFFSFGAGGGGGGGQIRCIMGDV